MSGRRRWLMLLVPLAAVLALWGAMALVLVVMSRGPESRDFAIEGDDSDAARAIRFVGVVADDADELRDADGKVIGSLWGLTHATWSAGGAIRRSFVLELPGRAGPLLVETENVLEIGTESERYGHGTRNEYAELLTADGRRLVVLTAFVPLTWHRSSFLGFSNRGGPVERVTLHVRFLDGPRGPAVATFTGPFAPGVTLQADGGGPYHLSVGRGIGSRGGQARVRLHLSTPVVYTVRPSLLIYDAEGRRHVPDDRGGSWGSGGVEADFEVPGLNPEQVSAVTLGEVPRERVFRNVRVAYPDCPPRNYPAYLDRLAQTLAAPKPPPGQYPQFQFKDVQEALRVLDLVRGHHVGQAYHALLPGGGRADPKVAWGDQAEKVHRTAAFWLTAAGPEYRAYGAALGLAGGWPEFVDPAIDLVAADFPATARSDYDEVRRRAAYALRGYRGPMSADQVRRLSAALVRGGDWNYGESTLRFLVDREGPETTAVLRELAAGDRPGFWFGAIQALYRRKALGSPADWTPAFAARVALVCGPKAVGDDPRALAARDALLARLLTPDLHRDDRSAFAVVLGLAAERLDPAQATGLFVRFLRDLGRFRGAGDAVGRIVRQLNAWHGTDIGGLGAAPAADRSPDLPPIHDNEDAASVAADAVAWADTGKDPAALDPDYRVRAGDLRLVWKTLDDPEQGAIGLWIHDRDATPWPRMRHMLRGQDYVGFAVQPREQKGRARYRVMLKTGTVNKGSSMGGQDVEDAKVPLMLERGSGWAEERNYELWLERADSPGGSLDGTKVFEDWKRRHLAP